MISNDNRERISNKEAEAYNLYTENIVEHPLVKYRRLLRIAELLFAAVIFGAVAAVTFAVLYPMFQRQFGAAQQPRRSGIVIERDEYPSDAGLINDIMTEGETKVPGIPDMLPVADGTVQNTGLTDSAVQIQKTIDMAGRSVVRVHGNTSLGYPADDVSSSSGIIFEEVDSEYIVLTRYDEVHGTSDIRIEFNNGDVVPGYYVKGDADTGLAIVCIKENEIPSTVKTGLQIAELGNSYKMVQGDMVVASGRVLGADFSANTGIVTNVTDKIGCTDAYLGLIRTNMSCMEYDYGYLFDGNGQLIGIPSKNVTEDVMVFYGISDLKAILEKLCNGSSVTYCGIEGENVTHYMSEVYGLPIGVYVKEVKTDSPAYTAGIQAGDVITSINDETILTFSAFSEKIYGLNSGDKATVNVKRLGKDEYKDILFSVTLGNKE